MLMPKFNLRLLPPLYLPEGISAYSVKPKRFIHLFTSLFIFSGGTPLIFAKSVRVSLPLRTSLIESYCGQ